MKYQLNIIALIIFTTFSQAQKKIDYVYPKLAFNKDIAINILDNTGTSKISGKALLKGKPVGYFMKVSLFPITDYFESYLELQKEYGLKGRKRASITPEALSYRIITTVDGNDGTFEFTNLKPGKYYIEGYLNIVKEKKSATYEGQDSYTFEGSLISGPPIFKEFTYNKVNGYYISGITEIKKQGEVATITIKN